MPPDFYHFTGTPVTQMRLHHPDRADVANDVPSRYTLFLLDDGEKKVTWVPETRKLLPYPPATAFSF